MARPRELRVANCESRTVSREPRAVNHKPRTTSRER
ncbi:glycosyl transferase [Burkholderia pseudomallei]|nr:glycosyl transferase [Burkholderia pseudomallei]AYX40137.1 glycosyl transferase [Burkholderia pseudomallei]MBG1250171.1 glycosyl transferase [Burkholderia pseudomallei]MBK3338604.1 glycosyl transferase [Burkholderia pseudomallei]NRD85662.1 glycosyl transferase [Burkholderia pseudomallei]